jgi:hypothetical protein
MAGDEEGSDQASRDEGHPGALEGARPLISLFPSKKKRHSQGDREDGRESFLGEKRDRAKARIMVAVAAAVGACGGGGSRVPSPAPAAVESPAGEPDHCRAWADTCLGVNPMESLPACNVMNECRSTCRNDGMHDEACQKCLLSQLDGGEANATRSVVG